MALLSALSESTGPDSNRMFECSGPDGCRMSEISGPDRYRMFEYSGPDSDRTSECSGPDRYRSTAESHNWGWKHSSCIHWRLKALLPNNDEDVFLSYMTSGCSKIWLKLQLEYRPRETPLWELWRSVRAFSEALVRGDVSTEGIILWQHLFSFAFCCSFPSEFCG